MKVCDICSKLFHPSSLNEFVCNTCRRQTRGSMCIVCGRRYNPKKEENGKISHPRCCSKECKKALSITPYSIKRKLKFIKGKKIPLYKIRFVILERDNFTCQYCGRTPQDGAKLAVDHREPMSKGGGDNFGNLITSCLVCNLGKGDIVYKNIIKKEVSNEV